MFDLFSQSPDAIEAYRRKLHRIASYHRWLLIVIVANIGIVVFLVAAAILANDWLRQVIRNDFIPPFPLVIVANLVYLLMVAPIVLLTREWAGNHLAITCAVILLWPYPFKPLSFIYLIALVGYHLYAVRYFRQNDVDVGLLGADRSTI